MSHGTYQDIASLRSRKAGIDSSDYDEPFDAKAFADGFSGKIRRVFGDYVNGFAVKNFRLQGGQACPAVVFTEDVDGGLSYDYRDRLWRAVVFVSHDPNSKDPGALKFKLRTCVIYDQAIIWDDTSTYTFHVVSVSGEEASIIKNENGFRFWQISGRNIEKYLDGEYVIDEYGTSETPIEMETENIVKENYDFLVTKCQQICKTIQDRLTSWEKDKDIAHLVAVHIEQMVNDFESNRPQKTPEKP